MSCLSRSFVQFRSGGAGCGLGRANACGVPKRGASVPARGAGASGRGGRCASGSVGRRQVTESIDVFPGQCGAWRLSADRCTRRPDVRPGASGRLAAASATQSIGGPGRWRLSDAGCGGRLRQVSIAGWHVGRARERLGRSALGRDGLSGKGGRAQVRSYGGVGVGGIFPDRLGCRRGAPGRDRPSRQARRATGALWLGGLS